jgi:hypothetical protein
VLRHLGVFVAAAVAWLAVVGCDSVKREAAELHERLRSERGAGAAAEAEDVFDDPPPGPAGLRPGRYRLRAVGATVTRRNAAGRAWDLIDGAGPDPELTVTLDGRRVAACPAAVDVTRVLCPLDVEVALTASSELAITVVDDDLTGDQPIGDAVGRDLTRTGRAGVLHKLVPRGQVTSAVVELIAVPPPPSPWAKHRGLLWGLGLGVGAGVLIVLAFGSALLTRTMVLPLAPSTSDWTCAFCDHRNPSGAAACGECGARRKKARPRDGDATVRPDADRAFAVAMFAAVLGAAVSVLISARDVPIDAAVPTGLGAAGLALAIAGWLHERTWRSRTAEAIVATIAVVALGPLLGQFVVAGLVIAAAIGVVVLLFWFGD